MKDLIKIEIEKATAAHPVTSTELIKIVRREKGERITARTVRFIVKELRNEGNPFLATRKEPRGYYKCSSIDELEAYANEVKNHALGELTTISMMKKVYFKQNPGKQVSLFG